MKGVLLIVTAMILAFSVACGNYGTDDSREAGVKTVTEHAVVAWVTSGPQGLHDFLSIAAQADCLTSKLEPAFAQEPKPSAWKETKDISFPSDVEAQATVVFESGGQEIEQQWSLALENYSWRISRMPGVENCATS